MRDFGITIMSVLGLVGAAMILLGIIDRNYQSLAIAGSILLGSVVIALSILNRR